MAKQTNRDSNAKTKGGILKRFGMIDRERIYNTAKLNELGIGRIKLLDARRSGIVTPFQIGNEHWYDGGEIIDWVKTQRKAAKPKPVKESDD